MKILFDQGTPVPLRKYLPGHVIKTAYELGWSTLLNGDLLRAGEDAGFDILLTTDKNLAYQQSLSGRNIAVVALSQNRWSLIQREVDRVLKAVNAATRGNCTFVEIPW